MQTEWQFEKCGHSHDAQGGSSFWKCSSRGALHWPVMVWGGGGLLLVLLILGIWRIIPGETPEQQFLNQVKMFLEGDPRTEGDISPDEADKLKSGAGQLKLTDKMDELIKKGKLDYLMVKKDALRKSLGLHTNVEIPPNELLPLCDMVRRMDLLAAVKGCGVTIQDFAAYLNHGEFAKAMELLDSIPNDPQGKRLRTELETPLTVDASLQYQKDAERPSPVYPFEAKGLARVTLTNRDNYRLLVSVSQDQVFLYIFQKDQYGEIKRVFPDPIWSRGVDNPIQKARIYQLPGEKEWFYVDELPPGQKDPITETIYLIASPWQAMDLELLYGKIYEATSPEVRKDFIGKFLRQLRLRNDPALKCVIYKEFAFEHGK